MDDGLKCENEYILGLSYGGAICGKLCGKLFGIGECDGKRLGDWDVEKFGGYYIYKGRKVEGWRMGFWREEVAFLFEKSEVRKVGFGFNGKREGVILGDLG